MALADCNRRRGPLVGHHPRKIFAWIASRVSSTSWRIDPLSTQLAQPTTSNLDAWRVSDGGHPQPLHSPPKPCQASAPPRHQLLVMSRPFGENQGYQRLGTPHCRATHLGVNPAHTGHRRAWSDNHRSGDARLLWTIRRAPFPRRAGHHRRPHRPELLADRSVVFLVYHHNPFVGLVVIFSLLGCSFSFYPCFIIIIF